MKLYEITEGINELADLDIPEECLADTLEALNLEFDEKAINIAKLIKNINGDIEAIKVENDRLASRKKAMTNRVESLKNYLRDNMVALDKSKIKDAVISVGRQQGRNRLIVDNVNDLPAEFIITTRSADNAAIQQAINIAPVEGAYIVRGFDIITIR